MQVGTKVQFWDWDEEGTEVLFTGVVEDRFTDPEERYARPSLAVRTAPNQVFTPYEDECREVHPC